MYCIIHPVIHILNKVPTEFQYLRRSFFMTEVNTQTFWIFELGTQENTSVPFWVILGFQQMERQNSENLNNDTFYRLSVTSAQCIFGTEKYPDLAVLSNYDDDEYSQDSGQFREAFRALT